MSGLTFGSDPEFMIVRKDSKELVSAIKVLKNHSKEHKLPINGSQAMFYDNVLLEFNVDPAHTLMEFMTNFGECLQFAKKVLGKDLTIQTQASAVFPATECDDEEAFIFGCDPEYCIYNIQDDGGISPSAPPTLPEGNTFRSCGGHIHIGHPIATIDRGNPPMVVKLMDAFVGATALLIDKDKSSNARRKLYGGAGTHRIASYGLEYRTLSNFWLQSPRLVEIIYKLTRSVVQLALTNPGVIDKVIAPKELQVLINGGKRGDAVTLFGMLRKSLPHELQDLIDRAATTRFDNMEIEWNEEWLQNQQRAIA